jgi:hypothetical protein
MGVILSFCAWAVVTITEMNASAATIKLNVDDFANDRFVLRFDTCLKPLLLQPGFDFAVK